MRFPEFNENWDEIKLKEIAARITRKNKENKQMLPLTISAQDGLISQYDYFDKKIASINLTTYYILKNGEFAYNKSYSNGYPYGAIKRLDSFEEGALSSLYICFYVSNIDSNYLCYYFDSNKWNYEVKIISGEGARNHGLLNLTPSDFFNIRIFKPHTLEEQCKISKFLELIYAKEKIINRKIDILKKYKKGVFLDTRKCSKKIALKTILSEVNIKTKYNNQYEILSSTAIGLFSQKEYFKHQVASGNNVGYKVIKKGQLLFSPQNLWLGNINLNNDFEIGMVSPSYKIYDIDNSINSSWLISMLKSQNMLYKYKQISEQGASVVRRNLDLSQFLEITLDIPNNQIQIGITLETIDKKINALSNLLMNLKNLKMHLLNEMFI